MSDLEKLTDEQKDTLVALGLQDAIFLEQQDFLERLSKQPDGLLKHDMRVYFNQYFHNLTWAITELKPLFDQIEALKKHKEEYEEKQLKPSKEAYVKLEKHRLVVPLQKRFVPLSEQQRVRHYYIELLTKNLIDWTLGVALALFSSYYLSAFVSDGEPSLTFCLMVVSTAIFLSMQRSASLDFVHAKRHGHTNPFRLYLVAITYILLDVLGAAAFANSVGFQGFAFILPLLIVAVLSGFLMYQKVGPNYSVHENYFFECPDAAKAEIQYLELVRVQQAAHFELSMREHDYKIKMERHKNRLTQQVKVLTRLHRQLIRTKKWGLF